MRVGLGGRKHSGPVSVCIGLDQIQEGKYDVPVWMVKHQGAESKGAPRRQPACAALCKRLIGKSGTWTEYCHHMSSSVSPNLVGKPPAGDILPGEEDSCEVIVDLH